MTRTAGAVLSLNAGSSSLKFALFAMEGGKEERLAEGAVERIGQSAGTIWLRKGSARTREEMPIRDHEHALQIALEKLSTLGLPAPSVAGHRVVHGGPSYVRPTLVDDAFLH